MLSLLFSFAMAADCSSERCPTRSVHAPELEAPAGVKRPPLDVAAPSHVRVATFALG